MSPTKNLPRTGISGTHNKASHDNNLLASQNSVYSRDLKVNSPDGGVKISDSNPDFNNNGRINIHSNITSSVKNRASDPQKLYQHYAQGRKIHQSDNKEPSPPKFTSQHLPQI